MHRTEGPDFTTIAGKRRNKDLPAPATVVNKDIQNASQEEVALAIENAGITLNLTGALDEAAGWGQLDEAILRRVMANVVAFGADPTGVADSAAAFTAAFAFSKVVYVPPGVFKLLSTVTIPDYGMLLGTGQYSRLNLFSAITALTITNTSGSIKDIYITGQGVAGTGGIVVSLNNAIQKVYIKNVWLNAYAKGIKLSSSADNVGTVFLDTIYSTNIIAGGIFVAAPELTGDFCPTLITDKLEGKDFAAGDFVLEIDGAAQMASRSFNNCNFIGGRINARTLNGVKIQNSFLDMDSYHFDGTDSIEMVNNTIGIIKTNTVNNDVNANLSRTFWIGNKYSIGAKYPDEIIYDGIAVKRERSGAQSMAVGTNVIDFDSEVYRAMTNHSAYTKTDPWDAVNKRFDIPTYGNRLVHVNCQVIMTAAITDTLADIADLQVYLNVLSGDGESEEIIFSKQVRIVHATLGKLIFTFNGHVHIDSVGASRYVNVFVVNGQVDAVNIVQTEAPYKTFIEVEGF